MFETEINDSSPIIVLLQFSM